MGLKESLAAPREDWREIQKERREKEVGVDLAARLICRSNSRRDGVPVESLELIIKDIDHTVAEKELRIGRVIQIAMEGMMRVCLTEDEARAGYEYLMIHLLSPASGLEWGEQFLRECRGRGIDDHAVWEVWAAFTNPFN